MTRQQFSRVMALFTLLWCVGVFTTACTTAWTSEANNIIQLLVPAITSIMSILSAFGVGLPANTMTAVQSWSNQATTTLETVAGLIEQYNTAEATAQPGILTEIETALSAVVNNLKTILPEVHVDNADTQAKITAIINLVVSEMQALINLVPALKGQVTSHEELKKLMADVQSPKEFKSAFNAQAKAFGKQYQI